MKKIQRLVLTIADELCQSENEILTSKKHSAAAARSILFLLALHSHCATDEQLKDMTGIRPSAVRLSARNAHKLCLVDKVWRRKIDKISHKAFRCGYWTPDMPDTKPKKEKKIPQRDINKNPFGMVYTDSDKLMMKRAIDNAFEFMEHYGAGEQPLRDGFPITRRKANPS